MRNLLVKLMGWSLTVLRGDPTVFDRWRWLRRHLQPGPLRTLDAGCGFGAFTMYAARIGNESIGISLEEEQIRRARIRASVLKIDQVQFIQADLRHLDQWMAQLGTFDQVICLETIEHILNDHKLLADLAVLLRPGGRLLLTTPFEHHKPLWGDRLSEREDGGHVRWGYAHAEMRALFNQCGLDVVVEEYISGFISQQITNLMRGLSPENSRLTWALTLPLRLCQVLDVPLTRLLNYPYLCIGMVGIKRDGDLR